MKTHYLFSSIILSILLVGCITVEEDYKFNNDGSGEMTYSIEYSEYGEIMFGLSAGDEPKEPIDFGIDLKAEELEVVTGLDDIQFLRVDSFHEKLTFKFNSIGALNEALCIILDYPGQSVHPFFNLKGKKLSFKRGNYGTDVSDYLDEDPSSESESALDKMKYNVRIASNSEIKKSKAQGKSTELLQDKSTVLIKSNFKQISEDNEALDLFLKWR